MKKQLFFFFLSAIASFNGFAQCSCGSSSSGIAYGESGSAALTLKKNKWFVETSLEYRAFKTHTHLHSGEIHTHDSGTTENGNELRNARITLGGMQYGLTDNITLSIQQPYLWINAAPKNTNGPGDLMFISTIKLFDKNDFAGAFLAGVKLPTGKKSSMGNETNSVIGSGSLDPVGGITLVKSFPKSFIRLNAFYKYSTTGFDKTNFGSFFSHAISFGYKLKTKEDDCAKPSCTADTDCETPFCPADSINTVKQNFSWNVIGGISGELANPQSKENSISDNSGGYSLFFQAGTIFGFRKWSLPVTLFIPLMQTLNGEQHQTNFRVRIGIVRTF